MPAKRRRDRRPGGSPRLYGVGVLGMGCMVLAGVGMWRGTGPRTPAPAALAPAARPASVRPVRTLDESPPFYPLEVGRFWVYRNEDPVDGTAVRQERRIARRERRDDRDLYFYDDGGMAYWQDGKVFEIGAQGSLNVIPLASAADSGAYAYRTQDMYVEKRIGAVDTSVVVAGRRYDGCLEVVTRLQLVGREPQSARSYSSYYARGIGLVGQEWWPREGMTVALEEYGVH